MSARRLRWSWGAVVALVLYVPFALGDSADTGGCDRDGDGHDAPFCGGDDCNDGDVSTFPGADEIADDGLDQDCDGYDAATVVMVGGGRGCSTGGNSTLSGLVLVLGALIARRRRC